MKRVIRLCTEGPRFFQASAQGLQCVRLNSCQRAPCLLNRELTHSRSLLTPLSHTQLVNCIPGLRGHSGFQECEGAFCQAPLAFHSHPTPRLQRRRACDTPAAPSWGLNEQGPFCGWEGSQQAILLLLGNCGLKSFCSGLCHERPRPVLANFKPLLSCL